MVHNRNFVLVLCSLLLAVASASPLETRKKSPSPYAPVYNQNCPATLLRSSASGVSPDESTYVGARKKNADAALIKWLEAANTQLKLSADTGFATNGKLPTIALASSGGGWRALLGGAGVISGMDSRDNNGVVSGMSGLYQAFTYHTALSGGSWLLSSIMGNGWQPVSWLQKNLWEKGFDHELLLPEGKVKSVKALYDIHKANDAKKDAKRANGQNGTSLTDLWGRLLSYELFPVKTEGAISQTLSAIVDTTPNSPWALNNVPFPIITSIGATFVQSCVPDSMATQYEFSPFEFGSWDEGVSSFTPTRYLGTSMNNGKAVKGCTTNYDNLGYVLGTSSTLFNEICYYDTETTTKPIVKDLLSLYKSANGGSFETRENYATYPNPFFGAGQASNAVSGYQELTLVDGGETYQNDPIWPLLHRDEVSMVVVNDNSADNKDHWNSGIAIYRTWQRAQQGGLKRMPIVPTVMNGSQTAVKDPQFFGCNDPNALMIVFIPNNQWLPVSAIAANQTTLKQVYKPAETDNMIANSKLDATQGANNADWPVCVACAAMKNSQTFKGELDEKCKACFSKYCYNPPTTTGSS